MSDENQVQTKVTTPVMAGHPAHPKPASKAVLKGVEAMGLEPTTSCVQSRCSPN